MKYRTIVADPPWDVQFRTLAAVFHKNDDTLNGAGTYSTTLPYARMSVSEISALSVGVHAESNSRLFLWTVTRYLEQAHGVCRAWGFSPSWLVTWCKPRGFGGGWEFTSNCEYLLIGRRGKPELLERAPSSWFDWPRPYAKGGRGPIHAVKPDAFYDLVESVSPGPYLELFARRQRLGWDTWGNEALKHVAMESAGGAVA